MREDDQADARPPAPDPGRLAAVTRAGQARWTRNLLPVIVALMDTEPVVVVNGARTAGKSTLLAALADHYQAPVVDLDDIPTRQAVETDPVLFAAAPAPVLVDEFQHVPDFLDAVKAELNRGLAPGRFVLTGSTRYLSLPTLSQSLAGRVHVSTLWPLSQGELAGRREAFPDRLLADPGSLLAPPEGAGDTRATATAREQYVSRVLAGGFPLALARPPGPARNRWYRDYVTTVVVRDVIEIRKIRQRGVLPVVLRQLAARTGQVLNLADIARTVNLSQDLVRDYVELLETVFLVHRLPAFGRTLHARVTARPKVHVVDTGLGAYLAGITEAKLATRDPSVLTEFGHLLESFAAAEICKQAGWAETYLDVSHYRTNDGHEVDLVLEAEDGRVAAVEVKASSRVTGDDLRGLAQLRDRLGTSFAAGAVLHLGERGYRADDRLWALPVDRLWS